MGCASTKITVDGAINDVAADPVKGIPNLQRALTQAAKVTAQQDDVKRNLPRILELLPQAMKVLNAEDAKLVVAACGVIDCCVAAYNGPSSEACTLDAEKLKDCVSSLCAWLKKAHENAVATYRKDQKVSETSIAQVEAIGNTMISLFKLEEHALACKEEIIKEEIMQGDNPRVSGVATLLKLMLTNGITMQAKQVIAIMLSRFVETQESLDAFIACSGTFTILPYAEEPKKYKVPQEMQSHCVTVLQACLDKGNGLTNRDACQTGVDKGAVAFASLLSKLSLSSKRSG